VLHVAERSLLAAGVEAEVELFHVVVFQELHRVTVHHQLAGLHDVAVVCDGEGHLGILLDEQYRGPLLVDLDDHVADLLDEERGQPEGRLVEDEELGVLHEGPPNRQHLLLATGQVAGGGGLPLLEPREHGHHPVVGFVDFATVAVDVSPGAQVVLDGHLGEDTAPLHHLADAPFHPTGRVLVGDEVAIELDLTLCDVALVNLEQPGDGAKCRGLPGPVGPEQGDDLAVSHFEGDAPEHEDHVVVDDLEILDCEHAYPSYWRSVRVRCA
jgi:hypothetical protein